MAPTRPSLRTEKAMLRAGIDRLAAIDEVGRGAPAGPVTCGVVVIDLSVPRVPSGLRDSKLLSASQREALTKPIGSWALDGAVGHASAAEIDDLGLTQALRRAGCRALARLTVSIDAILLDGTFDWLSPPDEVSLVAVDDGVEVVVPPVTTKVKADLTCASVAAASILAKVERDALMVRLALEHPGYGWESNKGYGAPGHLEGIRRLGLTSQHRKTWKTALLDDSM
jgi:ribonuclease HII